MIVNLANLSRSCLRPTFSNSTVILQLSPVSSMAVTVPFPKRAWQMNVPISTCPAAVATVDCVVEWVSPVGLESILVNRLPGDGAVNGLGAGVRSVSPRYGFSGRLLFGLYRHIDVSRIEVFDEPAWRGGDRLSVTIAGEGIREGAVFFCAGDGHIEQTSFFFDFPFTVFTHGRRKEVFFYSNNENLFELQSFRCMDRHQGYFVLLGFIAVVLICRQRNFG